MINYIGNYDYYLEKVDELTKAYAPTADTPDTSSETSGSRLDWERQKEEQARIRKRQNELKKTEDRITHLENRNSEIDDLMTKEEIFTDVDKCMELGKEKASISEELDMLYEQWELLCE